MTDQYNAALNDNATTITEIVTLARGTQGSFIASAGRVCWRCSHIQQYPACPYQTAVSGQTGPSRLPSVGSCWCVVPCNLYLCRGGNLLCHVSVRAIVQALPAALPPGPPCAQGATVLLLCGGRELPARDLISTDDHKVGPGV